MHQNFDCQTAIPLNDSWEDLYISTLDSNHKVVEYIGKLERRLQGLDERLEKDIFFEILILY